MDINLGAIGQATTLVIATMFPIVNPLGGMAIFFTMAGHYPATTRQLLARKIALGSFLLMFASMLFGTAILKFFGISIPAVKIGGGLLVVASAWSLLNNKDPDQTTDNALDKDILNHAFFPYTFPFTVGPGSISIAITLGASLPKRFETTYWFDPPVMIAGVTGMAVIALLVYICYVSARRLLAVLGPTGTNVVMRLTSFILLCIGVQIILGGVELVFEQLMGKGLSLR